MINVGQHLEGFLCPGGCNCYLVVETVGFSEAGIGIQYC